MCERVYHGLLATTYFSRFGAILPLKRCCTTLLPNRIYAVRFYNEVCGELPRPRKEMHSCTCRPCRMIYRAKAQQRPLSHIAHYKHNSVAKANLTSKPSQKTVRLYPASIMISTFKKGAEKSLRPPDPAYTSSTSTTTSSCIFSTNESR